jgi:hypothetical protein
MRLFIEFCENPDDKCAWFYSYFSRKARKVETQSTQKNFAFLANNLSGSLRETFPRDRDVERL